MRDNDIGEGDVLNLLTFDPIARIKFKSWERSHSQTSVDFYRSSEKQSFYLISIQKYYEYIQYKFIRDSGTYQLKAA